MTIEELKKEARKDIIPRVRRYSDMMGLSVGRIAIRAQKTKWGSCSSLGNLNFNCLLMLCPEPVRDYVIIHELCHLEEMNHSPRFWKLVESRCPDYKLRRKWLKEHEREIIALLKAK